MKQMDYNSVTDTFLAYISDVFGEHAISFAYVWVGLGHISGRRSMLLYVDWK